MYTGCWTYEAPVHLQHEREALTSDHSEQRLAREGADGGVGEGLTVSWHFDLHTAGKTAWCVSNATNELRCKVGCGASGLRVTADDMKTTSPVRTGQKNWGRFNVEIEKSWTNKIQATCKYRRCSIDQIMSGTHGPTCIWSMEAVTTTRPHMRVQDWKGRACDQIATTEGKWWKRYLIRDYVNPWQNGASLKA